MHEPCAREATHKEHRASAASFPLAGTPSAHSQSSHLQPPNKRTAAAAARSRLTSRRRTLSMASTLLQMGFASVSDSKVPSHSRERSLSVTRRPEEMLEMIRCLTAPTGTSNFRHRAIGVSEDATSNVGSKPHSDSHSRPSHLTITVENERGFEFERIETVPHATTRTRTRARSASCGDIPVVKTTPTPMSTERNREMISDRSNAQLQQGNPDHSSRKHFDREAPSGGEKMTERNAQLQRGDHGHRGMPLDHSERQSFSRGPQHSLEAPRGEFEHGVDWQSNLASIFGRYRASSRSKSVRPALTPKNFDSPPSLEDFV